MRDAASLLRDLGGHDGFVNGYRQEIRIAFNHTYLVLHYLKTRENEGQKDGYYSFNEVPLHEMMVDEMCLTDGCDACDDEYRRNDISYSATMYRIVRQIQQNYPDAIDRYEICVYDLDDCDLIGCPEIIEYGYRIYLKADFWTDCKALRSLYDSLSFEAVGFHAFYGPYRGKVFDDNCQFAFLGTNTKVRRIGYLGLMLSLFENAQRIAKKNLSSFLEQKAEENQKALDQYKNTKGVIRPSNNGVSSKPYIKLASELGVIREMTGYFELGKMGRVYLEAKKTIKQNSLSPFELSAFDRIFWLERLLEQDYIYLYTLLEYSLVYQNPSYPDLRNKFDGLVVEKLEAIHSSIKDMLQKTAIKNAIHRIKGWRKSNVYLEHILMPRLNWLYDIGLIELNDDLSFKLTREGLLLFIHMAEWHDLGQSDICNPAAYLDAFYMHIANELFMNGQGQNILNMNDALTEALSYSFEHFKTLAPNRVTYSVYQAFAKYTLLLNHSYVVESLVIKEDYLPSVADKYVFMYQHYYNDGFIQKK